MGTMKDFIMDNMLGSSKDSHLVLKEERHLDRRSFHLRIQLHDHWLHRMWKLYYLYFQLSLLV